MTATQLMKLPRITPPAFPAVEASVSAAAAAAAVGR